MATKTKARSPRAEATRMLRALKRGEKSVEEIRPKEWVALLYLTFPERRGLVALLKRGAVSR